MIGNKKPVPADSQTRACSLNTVNYTALFEDSQTWLFELQGLVLRYPDYAVQCFLSRMSKQELYGSLQFLRRIHGERDHGR